MARSKPQPSRVKRPAATAKAKAKTKAKAKAKAKAKKPAAKPRKSAAKPRKSAAKAKQPAAKAKQPAAKRRRSILELAGVSSFAELRARVPAAAAPVTSGDGRLTPADADRLAGGPWFQGYARVVDHVLDARVDGDLDIERRYAVYEGGLRVTGSLRLGDSRSIIAVIGDLEVGRLELGDDVLVVTGDVTARDYVLSRPNEGIFSVRGHQRIAHHRAVVHAPWYVAYDPHERELRVHRAEHGVLVEVAVETLAPELRRPDGRPDHRAIGARLAAGGALR